MKLSTKYVGLEGYQATTVASIREESGRVSSREAGPNVRTSGRASTRRCAVGTLAHLLTQTLPARAPADGE